MSDQYARLCIAKMLENRVILKRVIGNENRNGYGSKLNHQDMDGRFWSMFPLTRAPFWVITYF